MSNYLFGAKVAPSPICLGAMLFGSQLSKGDSFALLDAYVKLGGNFIDSAHIYAAWLEGGVGASERTVGEWIRAHGARDKVVLATKGGHPPLDGNRDIGRCSRVDLEQDLTESFERLGLDSVDLYWLHRDETTRPVGEIIEALASFVREGLIHSYGASNWSTARIQAANEYAKEHALPPFAANQPWFSLGAVAGGTEEGPARDDSSDLLRQWHLKSGLPMVPYSSQTNGYFGKENVAWAKAGFEGTPPRAKKFDSPTNRRRLQRAIELAEHKAVTANQIALAYLLSQPFPIFPIVGASSYEHLADAMGAAPLRLTENELSRLFR